MRPYSQDLRARIIAALETGERTGQVAARFAVSDRTVRRYQQLLRERASLAPRSIPGRRRLTAGREAELLAQVQADPDATLAQHCRTWRARTGQRLSLATMHRAIRRLQWTVKKTAECQRTRSHSTTGVAGQHAPHRPTPPGLRR